MNEPGTKNLYVLVKQHIQLLEDEPHIQGGRHAFACLATALAAQGAHQDGDGAAAAAAPARVHLVFAASRGEVLAAAAAGGWLPQLRPGANGGARWPRWRQTGSGGGGAVAVEHHAAPSPRALPGAVDALLASLLPPAPAGDQPRRRRVVLIVDADEGQQSLAAEAAGSIQQPPPPAAAQIAAIASAHAARTAGRCALVFFVQNIHNLPFGPAGCAPRAPALLAAWRERAAGAACVSDFVAAYVEAHASPPRGGGAACGERHAGGRVCVLSPAAVGAFGAPPWRDRGAEAATELWPAAALVQQHGDADSNSGGGSGGSGSGGWARRPVIGMIKRTPEKGAALFDALARAMPDCDFLAVDCPAPPQPDCRDSNTPAQSPPSMPENLCLVPPTADLDGLIGRMDVVCVPSLLQEAFGMVTVDAALRGVPCVVAAAGALPAAGGGAMAAAVAPVALAAFPLEDGGGGGGGGAASTTGGHEGHPRWRRRVLPTEQPVEAWEAAVRRLLAGRPEYEAASRAARAAALAFVDEARCCEELGGFVRWLEGL